MDSIPDFLPESVLMIVLPYWSQLLDWLSSQVYRSLVLHRSQNHLLVRLQAKLDLTPLEQACAAYKHMAGPGAPIRHAVPQLVRALLVKYLYDWSLRQLESEIRTNLVVKWFIGYNLLAAGPDHTTLQRFEVWVCEHQHRQIFDTVLAQIDREFPEERLQAQLGDTYAMEANAAREGLVTLIRHTCCCLLRILQPTEPTAYRQLMDHIDQTALFGVPDEVDEYFLDAPARQARLQQTVMAALVCSSQVQSYLATHTLAPPICLALTQRLNQLAKILADEVQVTRDTDGQIVQVCELAKKAKGAYRLGSATDPQATYRVHGTGDDKTAFGYNVSLATTQHFVREVQAATGAQPDSVGVPGLISAQITYHDVCPPKLIYDAAAGEARTRSLVASVSANRTQLVAPIRGSVKRYEFGPDDFTLSTDGLTLTCPHGQASQLAFASATADGRTFQFSNQQCLGCPLWQTCRGSPAPSDAAELRDKTRFKTPYRSVFVSNYRSLLAQARTYNQSEQYKADRKLRPTVERIIAALTRYNGARRCHRHGLLQADFQAKMAAVAYNLKKWLRLLALRQHQARTAVSPAT